MYELIILTTLASNPTTGYVIAKIVNDTIGPFARASNGRLYPLLARLEELGQLKAHAVRGRAARNARAYAITDAGRQRLRELMLDTASSPREYRELFAIKATALHVLTAAERAHLLDHYATFCRAHVLHLASQGDDLARNVEAYALGPRGTAIAGVMAHVRRQWELEIEWVEQLRAAEAPAPARRAPAKKPRA